MKAKILLLVSVTLALFVVAVALKQAGYQILGASPVTSDKVVVNRHTFVVGLLYYLLTLAGIAAGVICEALAGLDETTRVTPSFIKNALLSVRSWRGLVASPLVLLTVYVGVKSSPVTTAFVLLAFQNGFFWKAAMSRIMDK